MIPTCIRVYERYVCVFVGHSDKDCKGHFLTCLNSVRFCRPTIAHHEFRRYIYKSHMLDYNVVKIFLWEGKQNYILACERFIILQLLITYLIMIKETPVYIFSIFNTFHRRTFFSNRRECV